MKTPAAQNKIQASLQLDLWHAHLNRDTFEVHINGSKYRVYVRSFNNMPLDRAARVWIELSAEATPARPRRRKL